MNAKQIKKLFDEINESGEFICRKTYLSPELLVYSARPNINLRGREKDLIIDINFYLNINSTIFMMYISRGPSGIKSQLYDRVLMLINSVARGGFFAYYHQTGDVIFRRDVPTDYLDRQKIIDILSYFEQVYGGVRYKLASYAKDLGLEHITNSEHNKIMKDLEWSFTGLERTLSE